MEVNGPLFRPVETHQQSGAGAGNRNEQQCLVPADVGLARTGYRRPPRTAHGLGFGLEKRINRNEKQTNSVPTAPQDGWQKRRLYWLASGHCEPVPVAVLNQSQGGCAFAGCWESGRESRGSVSALDCRTSGSAVSPRLSGWPAQPGSCRPFPAPPPCCPGRDCP